MSLFAVILVIFYANVVTFGNGSVMVPILQQRFVDSNHVLTLDQLLYAFALARVTPGQANFYICSVGYFLYGLPGAILATAAIQLPGYLMIPMQRAYEQFKQSRPVQDFVRGLTATSVGLICAATLTIGRKTIHSTLEASVFGLMFVFIYGLKWNPLVSLAASTAIGLALYFLI